MTQALATPAELAPSSAPARRAARRQELLRWIAVHSLGVAADFVVSATNTEPPLATPDLIALPATITHSPRPVSSPTRSPGGM